MTYNHQELGAMLLDSLRAVHSTVHPKEQWVSQDPLSYHYQFWVDGSRAYEVQLPNNFIAEIEQVPLEHRLRHVKQELVALAEAFAQDLLTPSPLV